MAANTGLITSDPIESLEKASRLNLIGGGALLLAAAWLVFKQNVDKWTVPTLWIVLLIAGAVLLAIVSGVLRLFDGYYRYKLTGLVIAQSGLTAEQKAELTEKLGATKLVAYVIQPDGTTQHLPDVR